MTGDLGVATDTDANAAPSLAAIRALGALTVISLLVAVAMPIVTAVDVHFTGRVALALVYFLTVPGFGIVAALRLPNPHASFVVAVGLSLAGALVTSNFLLVWKAWHPLGVQIILSALAIVGAAVAVWQQGLPQQRYDAYQGGVA